MTSASTISDRRFDPGIFGIGELARDPCDSCKASTDSASAYAAACTLEASAFEAISGIDWAIAKMFFDLQHLSTELTANNGGIHLSNSSGMIDRMAAAQRHIDSLIHHRNDSTSTASSSGSESARIPITSSVSSNSNRSCAFAGLIYIHLFLLRTPVENPVLNWIIDMLKRDFETAKAVITELYTPELIFWILYIAYCGAAGRPGQSWFRSRINKYREDLHVQSWEDAESLLGRVCWIGSGSEFYGESVWLGL